MPENACVIDAVKRISGEPLNGFCENEVDLFLLALPDHAEKLGALLRGSSRNPLVCKNASHRPLLVRHDLVRVILALRLVAAGLFFFLGRYAAVRRHAELPLDGSFLRQLRLCGNDNDTRLVVYHTRPSFPMICPFLSCNRTV